MVSRREMRSLGAGFAAIATVLACLPTSGHAHTCIHNRIAARRASSATGEQGYASDGRRLQSVSWQPIRIAPWFVNNFGSDPYFTAGTASWVRNTLFPTAVARFADMLSVLPVVGGLKAHRVCTAWDESFTPAVCSRYESEVTAVVPPMTGDGQDVAISLGPTYLAQDVVVDTSASGTKSFRTLPAGSGFQNADTVVFVTGIRTSECDGSVIAYATLWQKDQFDRPVFGQINVCPDALSDMFAAGDLEEPVHVVMHEMTHVLMMDSSLFPLFRHKDVARSPRTPRDPLYPALPAPAFNLLYRCAAAGGNVLSYVPGNSTVQWFAERGMACDALTASAGNCVVRMVSPAAQAGAREFYGCGDLPGPELENDDTSPCQKVGSHWETRVAYSDMMNPFSTGQEQGFTLLTLSAFSDSGWYDVNFTSAASHVPRTGFTFGHKQGCGFARDATCLTRATSAVSLPTGSSGHYANASTSAGRRVCRMDRRGYGSVTLRTYSGNLPDQFRYFANPKLGGRNEQADYCPLIDPDASGACADSAAVASGDAYQGMAYGSSAWCLETSLMDAGTGFRSVQPVGCYRVLCSSPAAIAGGAAVAVLRVPAAPTSGGGASTIDVPCNATGQRVAVPGYSGRVTCPNVTSLCLRPDQILDAQAAAINPAAIAAAQAMSPGVVPAINPYPTRYPSIAPAVTSGATGNTGLPANTLTIVGIVLACLAGALVIMAVASYIVKRVKADRAAAAAGGGTGFGFVAGAGSTAATAGGAPAPPAVAYPTGAIPTATIAVGAAPPQPGAAGAAGGLPAYAHGYAYYASAQPYGGQGYGYGQGPAYGQGQAYAYGYGGGTTAAAPVVAPAGPGVFSHDHVPAAPVVMGQPVAVQPAAVQMAALPMTTVVLGHDGQHYSVATGRAVTPAISEDPLPLPADAAANAKR